MIGEEGGGRYDSGIILAPFLFVPQERGCSDEQRVHDWSIFVQELDLSLAHDAALFERLVRIQLLLLVVDVPVSGDLNIHDCALEVVFLIFN